MKALLASFLFVFTVYSQEGFIEQNTGIKNALKLRDPFKPPVSQLLDSTDTSKMKNGVYTNLLTPESLTLESVKVQGVLMGSKKRAILTGASEGNQNAPAATYMLSEGSKISNGTVELKAILPSGVIFVEKVTNVYGQTEYLETVVPISK